MLVKGLHRVGRLKNTAVTYSGPATTTISRFVDLAGACWSQQAVDSVTAKVLVNQLPGARRVASFNAVGRLIGSVKARRECRSCDEIIVFVEKLPMYAAPEIPSGQTEFARACSLFRRGPPMSKMADTMTPQIRRGPIARRARPYGNGNSQFSSDR